MRTGDDNGAEALLARMNTAAAQVIVFAPSVGGPPHHGEGLATFYITVTLYYFLTIQSTIINVLLPPAKHFAHPGYRPFISGINAIQNQAHFTGQRGGGKGHASKINQSAFVKRDCFCQQFGTAGQILQCDSRGIKHCDFCIISAPYMSTANHLTNFA